MLLMTTLVLSYVGNKKIRHKIKSGYWFYIIIDILLICKGIYCQDLTLVGLYIWYGIQNFRVWLTWRKEEQ